ncbi:hypothetical protein PanWU01x14_278410 [Parasponia andersonii]|uniref:Uncharacterized protein n=1 Tax=Parasponia andersonii TaxID=3476 RepID=A0A2P5B252_PARAD|nr:hypothetical protein PanWU01x14_278410 [Parasponia andersonii]
MSCIMNKLEKIVRDYDIDGLLHLSMKFNRPHTSFYRNASFSDAILRCSVYLPLHLYIKSVVDYYSVVPFQLTLNTYRYMVCLYIIYYILGSGIPTPKEFA